MKIIKSLSNNFIIVLSGVFVAISIILSFVVNFEIEQTNLLDTMQGINFTLFGFSITSVSVINGLMANNKLIKNVMEKGYFKRVQKVVWMILVSSIISLILNVFNVNDLLKLTFSIPCILGTLYCTYYILFLANHKTMGF